MEVFHASPIEVSKPDILHSRKFLDFGPGFYLTTMRNQAMNYASRFTRRGKEAWLNIYNLTDSLTDWKVLKFDKYDEQWLDYVAECRAGRVPDDHDIVIGGIANDKVFRTLDLYFSGDINKEEALKRLVFEKPNVQICIRNQQFLDQCVTFITSERL